MTEMKEKIYPTLPDIRESPSAPAIELKNLNDKGHLYRLNVITDDQNFLGEEISKREAFSKKYCRVAKYVNVVDGVLIGITVYAEGAGAVLLATGVAAPIALEIGISGVVTGAILLFGNIAVRKTTITAEKHLKIKMLASSKLDTIASRISKALMEELKKYKAMKEEIRSNTKKRLKEEEEASLIERGRQEARESFRRLVEKNDKTGI